MKLNVLSTRRSIPEREIESLNGNKSTRTSSLSLNCLLLKKDQKASAFYKKATKNYFLTNGLAFKTDKWHESSLRKLAAGLPSGSMFSGKFKLLKVAMRCSKFVLLEILGLFSKH